ncbi:MAG: hypothetical protein ACRD29_10845 [Acidimicrobiales bacterium]
MVDSVVHTGTTAPDRAEGISGAERDAARRHAPWKLVALSFALPVMVVGGLLATEWVRAGAAERANAVIMNNGRWVDLHAGPGTGFRLLDTIPDGTTVAVVCVAGERGGSGPSERWAKLDNGAWVHESFVYVEDREVRETCDSVPDPDGVAAEPDTPDGGRVAATIDIGGSSRLNRRSGPGTNFDRVGGLADGDDVMIECTAHAESVNGPKGETDVWDRLEDGSWVSDAYVDTGTLDPVAAPCDDRSDSPGGDGASPSGGGPPPGRPPGLPEGGGGRGDDKGGGFDFGGGIPDDG